MRWILISYFFLGSLCLFGDEPEEVALKFLRSIQTSDRSVKVTEDLAISVFCGPEKRRVIDARWNERAAWLRAADFELSSLLKKRDDDLAAVLVGARTNDSPETARVIALGLIKKEGAWKVAPVEGSFDNAGLGFGPAVIKRVDALEQWMALEKMNEASSLLEKERELFRKSMEGIVDPDKLKMEHPEHVVQEFLAAAHAGETEKLLVWQGVLERDQLPERDWERDIRATRKGMENNDPRSAWQTLRSNKVMKVIVDGHGDPEDADYLVAFLSTFRTDPRNDTLNPIRFRLFMTKEGWRIKLPPFFAYDHEDLAIHRQAFDEAFDWEDRNITREMGYFFEDENEPIRTKGAEEMLEGVVADLKSGTLHSFLQRHFREEEKFDEEEEDEDEDEEVLPNLNGGKDGIGDRRMERYREALSWWGTALDKDETADASIQKIYQDGDLALGVLKIGMDESGWKPKYLEIWMAKENDEWMILPGHPWPMSHSIAASLRENRKRISTAFEKELPEFENEYLNVLLSNLGLDDGKGAVIEEEEGLQLVKAWVAAATQGAMADLAKKSAVRSRPEQPGKFMRNLGYLRASFAASDVPDQFLGSFTAGRYRGFSFVVNVGDEVEPSYPLLIVVPTESGHRLLIDIELPLETNKGLRILNDGRIKALTTELSEKDLAAVIALHDWHQKIASPAWDQWNLERAAKAK